MRNLVICDIDGVIADCTHRLPWLRAKAYDNFYDRVYDDTPISDGIDLVSALVSDSEMDKLVFLTGRRDSCREATEDWLEKWTLPKQDAIFMRPTGDYRPAAELKAELYAEIVRMFEARGMTFSNVYYIDDDMKNIRSICDGDEHVVGLLFNKNNNSLEEE